MDLPDDLVREILLKLPSFKSALISSCVCKSWRDLIRNPNFGYMLFSKINNCSIKNEDAFIFFYKNGQDGEYQMQTNDSHNFGGLMNFPERSNLRIVGSCNGIICFRDNYNVQVAGGSCYREPSVVHLYNPITRQHRQLPPAGHCGTERWYDNGLVFGFDSRSNDYKVISIATYKSVAAIYKFSTNCWSTVDLRPFREYTDRDCVYVNGSCHWLQFSRQDREVYGAKILTFDFHTETFDLIDLSFVETGSPWRVKLCVLDNSIAVCICRPESGYTCNVWVMSEYEDRGLWSMKFSIATGAGLSWDGSYWVRGAEIFQLNPNGEFICRFTREEETGGEGKTWLNGQSVVFKPSLVSLRSGCFIEAL